MSRIYKITDRTNNKVYIGQTKRDIYKRFAEHIYRALNSQRKNDRTLAIYIAIVNHKPENFQVELLENVEGTPKQVDEREIYWIKQYDSTNPDKGYNLDKGGHVISEACRKAAEKHLFKTGDKLEGKMLENARANGMKVAKKVLQFDKETAKLIAEYPSIMEASRSTGCDRRSIQRQLQGEYGNPSSSRSWSNLKYIWSYDDQNVNRDYIVWDTINSFRMFSTLEKAEEFYNNLKNCPDKKIEELITHQKVLLYNMNRELKESL